MQQGDFGAETAERSKRRKPPAASGGRVFLMADDGVHGWELWSSDGTEAGTLLVKDVTPGTRVPAPLGLLPTLGTVDQLDVDRFVVDVLGTSYGDADLDADVDADDLQIVLDKLFSIGSGLARADFNGDSFTDVSDSNIWNANRDSDALFVPEPATTYLGLMVMVLVWATSRPRIVA